MVTPPLGELRALLDLSLFRGQFEYTGRTGEALQDNVATHVEVKSPLASHFANEIGRQDLPNIGGVTDPTGQGDCGAE